MHVLLDTPHIVQKARILLFIFCHVWAGGFRGFQGAAAGRSGDERAAMFFVTDDDDARETVKKLIREIGFAQVDVGGTADAAVMEAPRREGAVYGEEFSKTEALEFLEKARGSGKADDRETGSRDG